MSDELKISFMIFLITSVFARLSLTFAKFVGIFKEFLKKLLLKVKLNMHKKILTVVEHLEIYPNQRRDFNFFRNLSKTESFYLKLNG